jgi:hypothetical protein
LAEAAKSDNGSSQEAAIRAALCAEVDELRRECDLQGTRDALESIITAARAGKPVSHRLPEIGLAAGPAGSRWAAIPGIGGGEASTERYECPRGLCSRLVVPDPGAVPRCRLFANERMRRAEGR